MELFLCLLSIKSTEIAVISTKYIFQFDAPEPSSKQKACFWNIGQLLMF